ncbi:MAG: hypothetical protein J5I47_01875 [Vicingus serpentipes]|nr:hypothetical protein [Vicingus serpentipes]
MKQTPILFSDLMVNSILKGTKKQTRRTVKANRRICEDPNQVNYQEWFNKGYVTCPYGEVGDVLWVRETWKFLGMSESEDVVIMYKDGSIAHINPDDEDYWNNKLEDLLDVMAKKDQVIVDEENERYTWEHKNVPWKPSIHIPKEAARIWLKLTGIRVEKLQDISSEDAIDEGITVCFDSGTQKNRYKNYLKGAPSLWPTSYHSFQSLWESINGGDSWQNNPWVWVLEFVQIANPNNN